MQAGIKMSHKINVPSQPVVTPTVPSTNRVALCCGINDYPGSNNDLKGCVNDANTWFSLLKNTFSYNATILTNNQVTWNNVVNWLKEAVAKSTEFSHIVFTYSGHGSHVPDRDNDEEVDSRDECLCLYDKFLIDDDIRNILKGLHPKAKFTFISDSCHSGSVTRAFMATLGTEMAYAKPRYLPPKDEVESNIRILNSSRVFYPEEGMNEVLLTGCKSSEYSYDAYLNGKYMGAMSYYATKIIAGNTKITWAQLHKEIAKYLPSSNFPQSPQLEGRQENKNQPIFS